MKWGRQSKLKRIRYRRNELDNGMSSHCTRSSQSGATVCHTCTPRSTCSEGLGMGLSTTKRRARNETITGHRTARQTLRCSLRFWRYGNPPERRNSLEHEADEKEYDKVDPTRTSTAHPLPHSVSLTTTLAEPMSNGRKTLDTLAAKTPAKVGRTRACK